MSAMEKIVKIKVMVKKLTSQGTDKKQNNNNNNTHSAGHMEKLPNATRSNDKTGRQTLRQLIKKVTAGPQIMPTEETGLPMPIHKLKKRQYTNRQHTQSTQNTHRRRGTTPAPTQLKNRQYNHAYHSGPLYRTQNTQHRYYGRLAQEKVTNAYRHYVRPTQNTYIGNRYSTLNRPDLD